MNFTRLTCLTIVATVSGESLRLRPPAAFQFVHIITKVSSYPSIDSVARTLQLNRDLCDSLTIVEVNENAPSIQFAPSTTPDGGRFDIHQVVWWWRNDWWHRWRNMFTIARARSATETIVRWRTNVAWRSIHMSWQPMTCHDMSWRSCWWTMLFTSSATSDDKRDTVAWAWRQNGLRRTPWNFDHD